MRSLILIGGTFLVIAIAFGVYLLIESGAPGPATTAVGPTTNVTPPPDTNNDQSLHGGESPYIKSYDSKTGALTSEFRAGKYDPQPDGTVNMVDPHGKFYLGGGSMIEIIGKTGNVVAPNSTSGKLQGQSQAPSRGKLQDVILKLFHAAGDKDPQFTCWLNNLAFDNDTFRIATEDCDIPDASGKLVHTTADRVPVHVIGQDYDFDGWGLLIKWNERDRRLQRLEIAHGNQLIIKHPSAMSANPASQPTPTAQPHAALSDEDGPIQLASADPKDGAAVAKPTTHPKKPPKKKKLATKPAPASNPVIHRSKDPAIYRATFYDNVVVTQANATLATADRMNADFYMNGGGSSTKPTTASTQITAQSTAQTAELASNPVHNNEPAAEQPAQGARPTDDSETPVRKAPARKSRPAAVTKHPASTTATTQPEAPIIVHWTGKLIVIPPGPEVPPLAPNDSALEMVSDHNPVVLNRDGSIVHCASFRYTTLSQSVQINNSDALPIIMLTGANGSTVEAPSLSYDGDEQIVTIPGPAHAEFPPEGDARKPSTHPSTKPVENAKVDWSDSCELHMMTNDAGQQQIQEAILQGEVHVNHPQLDLTSDQLDIGFDNTSRIPSGADATQPTTNQSAQLHDLTATGDVVCALKDDQGKFQHITAENLHVDTEPAPHGGTEPSAVQADGSVHTFDDTGTLTCEHLLATLQPDPNAATRPVSTQPSPLGGGVQLKSLFAHEDVHYLSTDGSFADAEELHVDSVRSPAATQGTPLSQKIELMGQPNARVGDKTSTVIGPLIQYDPAIKEAHVVGPGRLHGVQQVAATKPTTGPSAVAAAVPTTGPTSRPVDITWSNRFDLNGITNLVDIRGDIRAKSVSTDGTVNTAVGDHLVMTLIDAPPTTAPATTTKATTKPGEKSGGLMAGGDNNFLKDKEMNTMDLFGKPPAGGVELDSISKAPDGSLARALNLLAPTVNYDKPNGIFKVPTPGRMLVRDFRKDPTTQPTATAHPTTQPAGGLPTNGMHGATAFQWDRDLVYEEKIDRVTMTGNVRIVHEAPGAAGYQMFAKQVFADLEPNPQPTTKPAKAAAGSSDDQSMKIKLLTAIGQVRLVSTRLQFEATTVIYDPVTAVMTARGTGRQPAVLLDENGLSAGTFDELVYNTTTEKIQVREFHANMRKASTQPSPPPPDQP